MKDNSAAVEVDLAAAVDVFAVVAAVAGAGEPEPYNAGPILSWHLVDFPRPCLQRQVESCKAVCHRSKKFSAYLAQSSFALDGETLGGSSPLLVSSCPPRIWLVTSSA